MNRVRKLLLVVTVTGWPSTRTSTCGWPARTTPSAVR